MTLYPKGLLALAGFGAVVVLAVNARAGHIAPSLAVIGMTAILALEASLVFGLLEAHRRGWYDEFIRSGMFSLRPLPKNRTERELEGSKSAPLPKDATRLGLGSRHHHD